MLGDSACRLLLYVFGYIFPAYSCFQAIEAGKDADIRSWCIYWLLLAVFTTVERLLLDWLIFWLPLYYEAKLLFVIYLWHPKTNGAKWLYKAYLQPFLLRHEPLVDSKLLEAKSWAGQFMTSHFQRLTSLLQSKALVAIAALQNMQDKKIAEVEKKQDIQRSTKSNSRRRPSMSSDSESSLDLPSVPNTKLK